MVVRRKKRPAKPDYESGYLIVKNTGGRPPRALERLSYKEGKDLLDTMNGVQLVAMMEKCGGDLEVFVGTFDRRNGKKDSILARVIYILRKPENKTQWDEWNALIECNRMAKQMNCEAEAWDALKDMPRPKPTASTAEWLKYAEFWTARHKEHKGVRAMKAEQKADEEKLQQDKQLKAVEAMVASIKAKSGDAGSQTDQQ